MSETGMTNTAATDMVCAAPILAQTTGYSSQLACCNQSPTDYNQGGGWNMIIVPYYAVCGTKTTVVLGPCQTYTFDLVGTDYVAEDGAKQTLTADPVAGTLTLANTDGSTTTFNSQWGAGGAPPGMLKEFTAPGGDRYTAVSYNQGIPQEVRREVAVGGGTVIDSWYTGFYGVGAKMGLRSEVLLRRSVDGGSTWTELRRVAYDYYAGDPFDPTDAFGSPGDLKTIQEQVKDGSGAWTTLGTKYFRYYTDGAGAGFQHGLKFYVGPEAFARIPSPLTASDATVALYADNYYEYDGSRRMVTSVKQGGLLTYATSYADNTDADGYNNWRRKTTITRPDGSVQIIYSNYLGQDLLTELRASSGSSDKWVEYKVYGESGGAEGKLVQDAMPSAVVSYVDNGGVNGKKLVVTLNASSGLIRTYAYYDTTTADETTPGGAAGCPESSALQEGAGGTPQPQSLTTYFKHTDGGVTVFPVAESTVYRNDDGTGDITTAYAYTWHSGTVQMKERVTTFPVVATGQNGSGTAEVRRELFDAYGHLVAVQDERGFIDTTTYDVAQGNPVQSVRDDDAPSGSGWTANGGTRLKLTTDFEADDMGRVTQTLGPAHDAVISNTNTSLRTAAWTVYDELNDRTLNGQGYATGSPGSYTYALVDPVSINVHDQGDSPTEAIVSARTSGSGRLSASDTFDQADWSRWTKRDYNDQGQLVSTSVYFLIPASGDGTEGTNFDTTTYGYDAMDRQNRVKTPGGTIARTVYDVRGLAASTWVGTDDTGATDDDPDGSGAPNNMVLVAESEYDGGAAGGDGNLTQTTAYAAASDTRVTSFEYDFRNRKIVEDGEIDVYVEYAFDNLNRVIQVDRKDTNSSGNLIGRGQIEFDDMGQVFQQITYAVDISTGTPGNALTTNIWYDESGNVIKTIAAGDGNYKFSKTQYDPINRTIATYLGYGTGTSYASAFDVTGDTVMEQAETAYDEASNVLSVASFQRLNDATGTGVLNPIGTQPEARISYVHSWYDPMGRTLAVANYGTDSTSRPNTPPARSDTNLVTTTQYNTAGEPFSVVDPKYIESRQAWDNAGRLAQRVDDYGGLAQTTQWAYTPDGQTKTLTAKNPATGDQVSTYTYGTTLSDSDVARSDLLRYIDYPGSVGGSDQVAMTYNRLGQATTRTDQRGVIRVFDYDKLGRPVEDRVTSFGGSGIVADDVKRISRTYEVRGMLETVTSYDDATSGAGTALNQSKMSYNDFGQLIKEAQAHAGVASGGTLAVQYDYDDGSTNQVRPTTLTYPSGRQIDYYYNTGSAMNNLLNRIESLKDGSTALATYDYLGLGFVIRIDYPTTPGMRLDLWGGGSGTFDGLDDFNRIVDQLWTTIGMSPTAIDRFQYAYDRNSNRQWRQDLVTGGQDELYDYDDLNRLIQMKRGTLTVGPPPVITSLDAQQDWALDQTGNWNGFVVQDAGGTTLDQARTASKVNEITGIANSVGSAWANPAYDAAGNMTTMPQPASPTDDYTTTYDAWNRLVELQDGSTTVAKYQYDGRNRRIVVETYTSGSLTETRHFYFTNDWQNVEERVGTATTADRTYVWGIRYIDELVSRDRAIPGPATERIFVGQDANFNVTCVVNGSAIAVERFAYDPYGKPLNSSAIDMTVLYAGYRYDSNTQTYCVRLRFLSSILGVWNQRDEEDADHNLYEYAFSSPLTLVDSLGLKPMVPDPGEGSMGSLTPRESERDPILRSEFRVYQRPSFCAVCHGDIHGGFVDLTKPWLECRKPSAEQLDLAILVGGSPPESWPRPIGRATMSALVGRSDPTAEEFKAFMDTFLKEANVQWNCYTDCMKKLALIALAVGGVSGAMPDLPIWPKFFFYPVLDPKTYWEFAQTGGLCTLRGVAAEILRDFGFNNLSFNLINKNRGRRMIRKGNSRLWSQGGRGALRGGLAAVAIASIYCSGKCMCED